MVSNMNFPLSRASLYTPLLGAQFLTEKINMSLQYGPIPQMDKISTWWQVDFIVSLPSCTGQRFSLYGIESSSESGFSNYYL